MAHGDSQQSGQHDDAIERSLASLRQLQARTREAFVSEAISAWDHSDAKSQPASVHPKVDRRESGHSGSNQTRNQSNRSHSNQEHHNIEHHQDHKPRRIAANDYILKMCSSHLNERLGSPPPWIQPDYKNPPPNLQCASTASNIYRMVLKESHCISASDSASYRWLDQVSVQKFMRVMEESGLAKRIPRSQVQAGDCVIGEFDLHRKPGNNFRHVGFVGHAIKGHGGDDRVAYSNACGTFRQQELNNRFGHYQHEYFLRLYLPKFAPKDS